METVNIQLDHHQYPIHIGRGLLNKGGLLEPYIRNRKIVVVTNETIAPLYLQNLKDTLNSTNVSTVVLPDGEQYKNLQTLNLIFDHCLQNRLDRGSILIALGGGVIGDMTGFAAACYQRGIRFIQVPTTLLAQVDSSVGGKTGVNHALGKNMIGAFHQPECVLIDIDTLKTLPQRELSAGLAEVIKYGLIRDADFFSWLEANMAALIELESSPISYAIRRSCEHKAAVVIADEHEKSGQRALLNLGHTFGHAIETGLGYGKWLHGEAVGCGMLMAAEFSNRLNWLDVTAVHRIRAILKSARLPFQAPSELTADQFIELMSVDKKVQHGLIRLVLLNQIGSAVLTDDFDRGLLYTLISELTAAA